MHLCNLDVGFDNLDSKHVPKHLHLKLEFFHPELEDCIAARRFRHVRVLQVPAEVAFPLRAAALAAAHAVRRSVGEEAVHDVARAPRAVSAEAGEQQSPHGGDVDAVVLQDPDEAAARGCCWDVVRVDCPHWLPDM